MALSVLKCVLNVKPRPICNIISSSYQGALHPCSKQYSSRKTEEYRKFIKDVELWDTSVRREKTSKAMAAYLQRAKENDEFMKQEQINFQIGKRHLANMMGEDPATFTQEDINRSIEYLFPSGIYDKAARPMMKSPDELFPARKAAEFDEAGRPFHFMFYTGKPNYFQLLHDIRENMDDLKMYHNGILAKKLEVDEKSKFNMTGYIWVSNDEFNAIVIETVTEREFIVFKTAIERLIDMPYSEKYKDFIQRFLKPLVGQKKALDIPIPQHDEDGRAFVTTYECLKKSARGHVTIKSPGTGLLSINGKGIEYFKEDQAREQDEAVSDRSDMVPSPVAD